MLVPSFSKAFGQLGEPRSRKIVLRAVALTLVIFIVLIWGANWLVGDIAYTGWEWLDGLLQLGGTMVLILVLFFVFPVVSSVFISIYLEDIAVAVEEQHYPDDAPGRSADLKATVMLSLRFAAVMLALNLLCLPLYIILFFIPPFNLLLFYALNGYLLSREYFELVSARHMPPQDIRRMRRRHLTRLWVAGAVIAFMLTVPLLNLVAPIVATAAMVHIFKSLNAAKGEPAAQVPIRKLSGS